MPVERVPREQILRRLAEDNPWWQTSSLPKPYSDWKPRPYLDLFMPVLRQLDVNRAIVLLGPRRVGKTVLLHHAIDRLLGAGIPSRRICYFTVDHPIYNGLGIDELLSIYTDAAGDKDPTLPAYVFFDEIQYLRNWERHLKTLLDRYPNVRVAVSGSAAAALRIASTESGAGRFTDLLLPPLTFHEFLHLQGKDDLVTVRNTEDRSLYHARDLAQLNQLFIEYINFGGYPEVVLSSTIRADPARYLKNDIVDKVLLRDLPTLYGIADVQELNSLFTTLAYNTGKEVSLEQIAQYSGVAKPTIKKYIEYLQAAFLIRVVHRLSKSAKRFERARTFKVYLTNSAMRTALFSTVEGNDPALPLLVENAVFSQFFHENCDLFYSRWDGGEVDLVAMNSGMLHRVVEIKWSDRATTHMEELKPLLEFCTTHKWTRAYATTMTAGSVSQVGSTEIVFFPTSLFAFAMGYSIVQGKLANLQVASGTK